MKSIKEKAEEKYPIITGELQTYNEKFIEGANYVLDEIERIVNSAIENKSIALPTWRLNYIIKQLKK